MAFQMMAVFILLAFYGCYFLKMISQRRKGIKTDQIGKGKIGFTKVIEITMKIVTYIVPFIEVISIAMNKTAFAAPVRGIGACIAVIGVGVFIISVLTMQDSWRAGVSNTDRTELVTKGIYQISRNPAFLGFDLVYIGMICMFFNWPLLFVSIWAMVMFHLQIRNVEEVFLLEAFGEAYLNYKNKVCRYIGRKGKYGHKNNQLFPTGNQRSCIIRCDSDYHRFLLLYSQGWNPLSGSAAGIADTIYC